MNLDEYNKLSEDERVGKVFGIDDIEGNDDPNDPKLPEVDHDSLETYFEFLEEHIGECDLTGRESMGYFGWEERYFFTGKDSSYEKTAKQRGSMNDVYKLVNIEEYDDAEIGLLANVKRIKDGKKFKIPLQDLKCKEDSCTFNNLIDDYSYWFVNYGC